MDYWESKEEYALDISLFKDYWKTLSGKSLNEKIEIIVTKLKEKVTYDTYSEYSWEEMSKYVFYEDLEFVLKQLESYKVGNGFYSMQLVDYPYLVERRNLLIEILKDKNN